MSEQRDLLSLVKQIDNRLEVISRAKPDYALLAECKAALVDLAYQLKAAHEPVPAPTDSLSIVTLD